MSWRTVCISRRAKLEYQMGYLIIRQEDTTKIHLSEIALLLVESNAVSLTARLLTQLIQKKIKVVFCDENHNPASELVPYYGSHDSSKAVRNQVKWSIPIKSVVWQKIVMDKIAKQAKLLDNNNHLQQASLLRSYISEVEPNDLSNREGHAAKVYFNALFGLDFSRDKELAINGALDYGYSLLLASFNREVVSQGCLTQIGIWHDNIFNYFNLSSDLMEAFRPLVDAYVISMNIDSDQIELEKDQKHEMLSVLENPVMLDGKVYQLPDVIRMYTRQIIRCLNEETLEFFPVISYG